MPADSRLLDALVDVTLVAMPHGLVPTRGFMSAVLETAVALTDAWLTAYVAAADGEATVTAAALQRHLDELVGPACSKAWWNDAVERTASVEQGASSSRPQSSQSSTASTTPTPRHSNELEKRGASKLRRELQRHVASARSGGTPDQGGSPPVGGSDQSTLDVISGLMKRSVSCVVKERCALDQKDGLTCGVPGAVWLRFGAAWALCGLEDILGSVAAHCLRKVEAAAQRKKSDYTRPPRPGAPGSPNNSGRPGSSGGRPGSSGGYSGGRPGSSGGRPGTSSGRPTTPANSSAVNGCVGPTRLRMRLLAIKHLVACIKDDDGLKACGVLEAAIVEVLSGQAQYVQSADLMSIGAYRELLGKWAEQESASGEDAGERAIAQALEGPKPQPAPTVARPPPKPATKPKAAPKPKASLPGKRGWIPQQFVIEFNEEGEEVDH